MNHQRLPCIISTGQAIATHEYSDIYIRYSFSLITNKVYYKHISFYQKNAMSRRGLKSFIMFINIFKLTLDIINKHTIRTKYFIHLPM